MASDITPLTGGQIITRIAALIPRNWASDDAKLSGNVYAALLGPADGLSFLMDEIAYVANATRIQTETAPELDIASVDFFGASLPRPAGLSDGAFASLIISSLFRLAATRPAMAAVLQAITGSAPRLLEPWNVRDTGAWGVGGPSYWNVDTAVNPARWGNGSLRYQGFIETPSPQIPVVGANNPILTWGSAYWNVPGYFFGIIESSSLSTLYAAINNTKAAGTVCWVKIVNPSNGTPEVAPSAVGKLAASGISSTSVVLTWTTPAVGTPPFSFTVFYRATGNKQFYTGPTVAGNSATCTNLGPNVSFDFEVIARNPAGQAVSSIISAVTLKVAPSPVQNLAISSIGPSAVTLTWSLPAAGTPPFLMQARYRVTGATTWVPFGTLGNYTTITITGLQPGTEYDFDVVATN